MRFIGNLTTFVSTTTIRS